MAELAECNGVEAYPNKCVCPCEGCKYHCAAHEPQGAASAPVAALREPVVASGE